MKKILFAIIALAVAAGCTDNKLPVALGLEQTSVTINAKGEPQSVKVFTNAEGWTADFAEANDWCTIAQSANILSVSATENTSIDGRSVIVVVRAGKEETTLEVKQAGVEKTFKVSTDLAILNPDGTGKVSVEVTSNIGKWTAELADETYFKMELTENGFDLSALSANSTTRKREAKVNVTVENVEKPLVVTVRQHPGLSLYHIKTPIDFSKGRVQSVTDDNGAVIAKICREYIRESSEVYGQKTVLYLAPDNELDMAHGIELESGRTITWDPTPVTGEIISFAENPETPGEITEFWISNSGRLVTELGSEEDRTPKLVADKLVDSRDGNVYGIVKIGVHWWMTENLRTGYYANGDRIDGVWEDTGSLVYIEQYLNTWGCYYNGFAVTDERGLAPEGWMVPDNDTWNLLITRYTRKGSARYKSTNAQAGWPASTADAAKKPTDDTGFNALATYFYNPSSGIINDSQDTWFWSSTTTYDPLTKTDSQFYVRITDTGANLLFNPDASFGSFHSPQLFGHNVRCAKKCFEF